MQYQLRDYQQLGSDDASTFFATSQRGDRRLYAAPTGCGKSVVELDVMRRHPDAVLLTPRREIIDGMLSKLGYDVDDTSGQIAASHNLYTPITYRNRLAANDVARPSKLILDESHHHNAATYRHIDLYASECPTIGYTATPYRGTPRETAKFRETWGDPVWLITYPEAAAAGYISIPTCRVVPLVDDDAIEVRNGEFVVESASKASQSRLDAVADLLSTYLVIREPGFDRSTMVAVSSVDIAAMLHGMCTRRNIPTVLVTGDTSRQDRRKAFDATVAGTHALICINVVSEGVDLPLRRLIDLRPTLSPVYWLQLVGRITRPSDKPPEYVCLCRNLERHGYLMQGCLPPSAFVEAQEAFGAPSQRQGSRVVGFESLGRFKAAALPLASGVHGLMYSLQCVEGTTVRQYCIMLDPTQQSPFVATRLNVRGEDGRYGKWQRCELPDDVQGFASVPANDLSDKQLQWWKRSAKSRGLDPDAEITNRSFQALPVLFDTKRRFK